VRGNPGHRPWSRALPFLGAPWRSSSALLTMALIAAAALCVIWQWAARSPLSSHGRIPRMVPPGARVLDVGAEGNYVGGLKEEGCRVVGVNDYSPPHYVTDLYSSYHVKDLDREAIPDQREVGMFDCIVLADLLEHLTAAPVLLSSARSLLSERGTLIASTGNVANWTVRLALLFGRFTYRQRGILDDGHVHLYTYRSFKRLLEGQMYRVCRTKVTPIPFELVAGRGSFARSFWKTMEHVYCGSAGLWPTLFAYQFILMATPAKGIRVRSDSFPESA